MRRDECLTIRADLIDEFPDGVPAWMAAEPPGRARELMDLRRRGYELLGLASGDDDEDEED